MPLLLLLLAVVLGTPAGLDAQHAARVRGLTAEDLMLSSPVIAASVTGTGTGTGTGDAEARAPGHRDVPTPQVEDRAPRASASAALEREPAHAASPDIEAPGASGRAEAPASTAADRGDEGDEATGSEPSDSLAPVVLPGGLRPAEIVAARVRRVLGQGTDPEAWRDLAGALPEMALAGDADPESTFSATRVAESVVSGPGGPPALETVRGSDPGASAALEPASAVARPVRASRSSRDRAVWLEALRRIDVELFGTLFALVAAGVVVWTTVRTQAPRLRPVSPPRAGTRMEQVRALAASGASEADIARRTGIPRDAVAVLMRVSVR